MRKTVLLLLLIIIVIIMAAACDYEDHDGKVVDKIYEKESDTYMNIGNGVSVPVFGSTNYYVVVEDDNGDYAGIYEWVQDLYPLVKYFCETTGQKLVVDDDTTTGATYRRNSDPDAVSGASTKAEKVEKTKKTEEPDTTTGASQH